MIGTLALVLAVVGLALTACVQIRPLKRHRAAFDALALLPEWRFYAQATLQSGADLARDTHIVVRDRDSAGRICGWTPVLWPVERRLGHALWNPRMRVDTVILSIAEDIVTGPHVQQSIGYLVVLRRALAPPRGGGAVQRQFAVVHAVGRGTRALSIDFVSAWHSW